MSSNVLITANEIDRWPSALRFPLFRKREILIRESGVLSSGKIDLSTGNCSGSWKCVIIVLQEIGARSSRHAIFSNLSRTLARIGENIRLIEPIVFDFKIRGVNPLRRVIFLPYIREKSACSAAKNILLLNGETNGIKNDASSPLGWVKSHVRVQSCTEIGSCS